MPEQNHIYENLDLEPEAGFNIRFVTMKHNSPYHWHRELELIFILNGHATVNMDGERHSVKPLDVIVMDFAKIHEVTYALLKTMGICIHISRQLLRRYLPELTPMVIRCSPSQLLPEQEPHYMELCGILKELTILYVDQKDTYRLRSTALILELLACLVEHFSEPVTDTGAEVRAGNMERLDQICTYVEHHYAENLTLTEAAEEAGLNKEYFCRFFKQHMGTSFIQYVNQVRLGHIYQDLLYSDGSVQEIMERHGFYNQKLFYRMFKERYGCTPRQLKDLARNNPYL